jgi:uncharacterized protein (TIGR03067 family)
MNRWSDFWTLCKVGAGVLLVLISVGFVGKKVAEWWVWRGIARFVAPDDRRDIQGIWVLIMAEESGRAKAVPAGGAQALVAIDGNRLQFVAREGEQVRQGEPQYFTLDPARKAIDVFWKVPGKPEPDVCAGIYQLTANRLELCLANTSHVPRPTEFKTAASGNHNCFLLILERE